MGLKRKSVANDSRSLSQFMLTIISSSIVKMSFQRRLSVLNTVPSPRKLFVSVLENSYVKVFVFFFCQPPCRRNTPEVKDLCMQRNGELKGELH